MPEVGKAVVICYGLKSVYESLTPKDVNTIYICTDTGEIYLGDSPLSPQILNEMPSQTPENTNSVLNSAITIKAMQDNYDELSSSIDSTRTECKEYIDDKVANKLAPDSTSLADGTYMQVKSGSWQSVNMVGNDYDVNRLRGISIKENYSPDDPIQDGCFIAYLEG